VIALNFGSISKASRVSAQAAYDQLTNSPALMAALNAPFSAIANKYPEIPVGSFAHDDSALPALLNDLSSAMDCSS
jgi:hypothetical protein